jgi:p-aminobenzoyl-glutamate transporter AbgT
MSLTDSGSATSRWRDRLEWAGNRLPDLATPFLAGTFLVMLLSQLAVWRGWSVQETLGGVGQGSGEVTVQSPRPF